MLVRERGVSVAPAAGDLDVHENVLRSESRSLPPTRGTHFPAKGR
jgi:hypothetical protein